MPTRTVTGAYAQAADAVVKFILLNTVTDLAANETAVARTVVQATLDQSGAFSVDLICQSPDLDVDPVYQVVVAVGSILDFRISVPSGTGSVDITDLAPAGTPLPPSQATELQNQITTEVAAREAADALLTPLAQKGVADGVATLGPTGTVPDAQIPATIARDTEIAAAVAALVGASPALRDTLEELNAVLTSDESAAAALAALVALKAPLAAPALTGLATLDGSPVLSRAAGNATYLPFSSPVPKAPGAGVPPFTSLYDIKAAQYAARASTYLTLTTYLGSTNSVVEPSIEYVPDGWGADSNGKAWRYWMVAGVYESRSFANENPSIWVFDKAGDNPSVPPGLTNPVIPARSGDGNNCDPGLFFDNQGVLYLSWTVQNSAASDGVYYVTSTDGIAWSAPVLLIVSPTNASFLSCRLQWFNGNWHAWYLDASGASPYAIYHRTATTLAGLAAATPTAVTGLSVVGTDTALWEFEVKRLAGEWMMLLNTRFGPGNLTVCTSADGVTWKQSSAVLTGTNGASDWDYQVYKSAFVPVFDGARVVIHLWYNGWNNGTESHIGYTKITNAPSPAAVRVVTDYSMYKLVDSFDRGYDAALGSPDVGNAWQTFSTGSGSTPGINLTTKKAVAANLAKSANVVDCGTPFGTLTHYLTLPASGVVDAGQALCQDGVSNGNMLLVTLARDASTYNKIRLYKADAGVFTQLAISDPAGLVYGTTYRLDTTITPAGVVTVLLDGVQVMTYTLSAGELTKYSAYTRHGFYANNDRPTQHDDIRFKAFRHA